jgi:putative transposase
MKHINDELARRARAREGRGEEPTAAILDSQSVKGSVQARDCGYDAAKKIKGRKRHVLVDTLGFILALAITAACVQDRDMAGPVVRQALLEHSYIHKVWTDGVYTGQVIEELRQTVDVEVVKRPYDANGFVILPRRWVVERTLGWTERFRLLSREYERTTSSSCADIYCAMSMILARRITSAYRPSDEYHGFA